MVTQIIYDLDTLFAGVPRFDTEATDPESLGMLAALLYYLQPKLIVEAGTYRGHFAVMAARILPESTVWTADPITHGTIPELANLHVFHEDFTAMMNRENLYADFAFIDSGDRAEQSVRWRHWEACKPRMRVGGLMVCHDTNNLAWQHGPEIAGESLLLTGGRGLALWRKP